MRTETVAHQVSCPPPPPPPPLSPTIGLQYCAKKQKLRFVFHKTAVKSFFMHLVYVPYDYTNSSQ